MRHSLCSIGLVMLLAGGACGDVPVVEAVVIDAAPVPDGPLLPGEVTLRVHDEGTGLPRPGATAVFTRPDGTLVGTALSGPDGIVRFEIDHGDNAHVGWRVGNENPETGPVAYTQELVTILGLVPGDTVDVNRPAPPAPMVVGQVTVGAPSGTPPATATHQALRLGCLQRDFPVGGSLAVELNRSCLDANNQLTVLIVALDDNQRSVAYSLRKDVVFTPNQNIIMPAWQSELAHAQVTIRPPAGTASLQLGLAHTLRDQIYEDVSLGLEIAMVTEAQATFDHVPGYANGFVLLGFGSQPATVEASAGLFILIQRGPVADLEAGLRAALDTRLPRVTSAIYAGGAFRWTTAGGADALASAEAVRMTASWMGPFGSARWIVLAPPAARSPLAFKLYDLIEYLPPPVGPVTGSVALVDVDELENGYSSFKNDIGTGSLDNGYQLLTPALLPFPRLSALVVGTAY